MHPGPELDLTLQPHPGEGNRLEELDYHQSMMMLAGSRLVSQSEGGGCWCYGDFTPVTLLPRRFPYLHRTAFPFRRSAWNRAKSRECWRCIEGNVGPRQSENDHRKGTA